MQKNQNNIKTGKPIAYYMRSLHRDIGFFIIGLTIIFSLSGILLIYRDSGLLQYDTVVEKKISPQIESDKLGEIIFKTFYIKDFKVIKTEGEMIYFQDGSYNKATGVVTCTTRDYPFPLNQFVKLHMVSSRNTIHWFITIYGIGLLFLALSSFWMYKVKTRLFRRCIYIAGFGIVFSIILLL